MELTEFLHNNQRFCRYVIIKMAKSEQDPMQGRHIKDKYNYARKRFSNLQPFVALVCTAWDDVNRFKMLKYAMEGAISCGVLDVNELPALAAMQVWTYHQMSSSVFSDLGGTTEDHLKLGPKAMDVLVLYKKHRNIFAAARRRALGSVI